MWDQLGRISQYQKHGTSLLIGLQNFAIGYNKLIKKFSEGLRRCSTNFEKDMFSSMRSQAVSGDKGESSDLEFSTLSIAVTSIRSGVDVLATLIEESMQDVVGDLVEPLEMYQKHYTNDCADSIQKGSTIWAQWQEQQVNQKDAKEKFYTLKEQALEQESIIEDAMKQHEQGQMTIDKVQRISKKGVTIKYKAEVASQTYKQSIEATNNLIRVIKMDYSPQLQKLQQLEESRINFMKYNLEKMMKHISQLGTKIATQSKKVQE